MDSRRMLRVLVREGVIAEMPSLLPSSYFRRSER